jgi:hypothetical protein
MTQSYTSKRKSTASGLSLVVRITLAFAVVLLFIVIEGPPSFHHRRRLLETPLDNEEFLKQTAEQHSPLFQESEFTVVGPSAFPKPTRKAVLKFGIPEDEIVNNLSPTSGTHRHDQDAIFLFAAEYSLNTYILFLSSLRETGYDGDVVLAISKHDYNDQKIRDYLEADPHAIVYVIEYTCFNFEMEQVDSVKGGMRVCQCDFLYGRKKSGSDDVDPLKDPREARTVATTRYEIYSIWADHYAKHSWLMLIDARDTVFQSNPFENVPRESDPDRESGVLFFFGVRFVSST